ncbi:MAG: hypothetical protein M3407_05355 [Acidobacteriota bacterium]|nr:hypothetical protein [Acidobacteriota bacterium]
MLRELRFITPDRGLTRRWFVDDYFDLIVWHDARREIVRFQLCYDKRRDERALTWQQDAGFAHERVDEGGASVWDQRAPVLRDVGGAEETALALAYLRALFAQRSAGIDPAIASFVCRKLAEHEINDECEMMNEM